MRAGGRFGGRLPGDDAVVKLPLVAIVGAPNVGKSRLFNRLTGQQRSIVHDRPGVTRDRVEGIGEWSGRRFRIVDTGGLAPGGTDELTSGVERQVLKGIEEASLVVLVVDGRAGLSPLDESLAKLLRRASRPILLAVNKVDAPGQEGRLSDFFRLGFAEPIPISAEEGRGLGTLADSIVELLPAPAAGPETEKTAPLPSLLGIVGKPNVGKSTLFNRLVGEERAVVSSLPGTTRDPVDAEFCHLRRRYRIVDTAGVRRKARPEGEEVEMLSIERALSAMKRSDLVVVLMDALQPVTHQDLAVLGACQRVRRPIVVAANKVDRLPGGPAGREVLREAIRSALHFALETPVLMLSARTGEGVDELLDVLDRMADESSRHVPTPDLNRALEEAVRGRSPAGRDRIPRLYYITQTGTSPPSFVVFTNGASIDASYRRYLARHLRQALGFSLTPIALRFRRRL